MAVVTRACRERAIQTVHEQPTIRQAGELVVKRQTPDFGFGQLALGNVPRYATVPRKNACIIKNGLTADGYPDRLATLRRPLHLEIVKNRMGVQLFAMGTPLAFADEGVGQLPARKAIVHLIGHSGFVIGIAIETHKTELRVLFPIPVGRQVGQAAPACLTQTQSFLCRQVVRDVGEGTDTAAIFQHARTHFDVTVGSCSAHIHLRHRETVTIGGVFRCDVATRRRLNQVERGSEVPTLRLIPHHVLRPRLVGHQRFGQIQKLAVARVVHKNTPPRVHIRNAL